MCFQECFTPVTYHAVFCVMSVCVVLVRVPVRRVLLFGHCVISVYVALVSVLSRVFYTCHISCRILCDVCICCISESAGQACFTCGPLCEKTGSRP